jgi:hypothetical protein
VDLPQLAEPQLSHALVGLARNPTAPTDVLYRLVSRPAAARKVASRHDGSVTEGLAHRLLALDDHRVDCRLAANSALPAVIQQRLAEHADSSVRQFLARSGSPPPVVLQSLAADPDPTVREAVAESPDAPSHIRELLIDDPDARVRFTLARSWSETPEPALRRLLTDPDAEVRGAAIYPWRRWGPAPAPPHDMQAALLADPATRGGVLAHIRLTAQLAAELAIDPDEEVRRFLAAHPDLPAEVRARLAECNEPLIRAEIAARRDTPEELRVRLLNGLREESAAFRNGAGWMAGFALGSLEDRAPIKWLHAAPLEERLTYLGSPHTFFRLTVAVSEDLPRHAIERLLADPDSWVRLNMALKVPDLTGDVIEQLERRHIPSVRRSGSPADHPNFPPQALRRFAADPDPRLRELACRDPDLPSIMVAELAIDPQPQVRRAAAAHPNVPPERIALLLADEDVHIVEAAAFSTAMPLPWMYGLLAQTNP